MHIHQVISSILQTNDLLKNDPSFNEIAPGERDKYAANTVANLTRCVSYHFEDIERIQEMTNKAGELFSGDYGHDIRLPHPASWFDFQSLGLPGISLAGIAAFELDETALYVETYTRGIGQEIWLPSGLNAYIGTGDRLDAALTQDRVKNLSGLEEIKIEKVSENLWITGGIYKNCAGYAEFDQQYQEDKRELMHLLRCFNSCLLLLSCKNIVTETIKAPAKINKKRAKSGKPLIQDHRVLKLVLPKKKAQKKEKGEPGAGGGWVQKPSFCSGHFKYYSADAPLFGRLTGRYWWEPHVRGGEVADKKQFVVSPRRK
jgi:hypothetical protein